jgi:hypothetical protein
VIPRFTDGDLLSERGYIVATNAYLLRNFHPMPSPAPVNYGLDAVQEIRLLNDTTARRCYLFSVEKGFFDEALGVQVGEGDLLGDWGRIVASNRDLLRNFHPMPPTPPLGLDAVCLPRFNVAVDAVRPPEIWFSTEQGWFDEKLGRHISDGDLLSTDVGVFFDGYAADAAITTEIGRCSPEARRLISVTEEALRAAIEVVRAGVRLVEDSRAIEQVAVSAGFSVVRQYTGHGIGTALHEEPQVPNFVTPASERSCPTLPRGATIAIEPMVNAGKHQIEVLSDGWTVVTKDRRLSAHFEHTVAVDREGPLILTMP